MIGGLFRMFLLSKLFGGSGRPNGRGKGGCAGIGCMSLIVILVIAFFIFKGCDGGAPDTDF
jgi:hypothetical protein